MLRNQIKFKYECRQIETAANTKAAYHRQHEKRWHKEHLKSLKILKASGVQVQEYTVTGGFQVGVNVNANLKQRLDQSLSKLKEHQRQAEEFEMYARAMKLNRTALVELDSEDIRFFGL